MPARRSSSQPEHGGRGQAAGGAAAVKGKGPSAGQTVRRPKARAAIKGGKGGGQAHAGADLAANRHQSGPVRLSGLDPAFQRADLEFHGVDHSGPSFEARVFFNNPKADDTTPKTDVEGYAGSFHIFGHGGCYGDVGHCDVRPAPGPFDVRRGHPLTPARKKVIVTEALRRALQRGGQMTVTVVPVITSMTPKTTARDALKFHEMRIVTYR